MTINETYQFIRFLAAQSQSGRFTPINFNLAAKQAQLQRFNNDRSLWQDTQIITDALAPFLNTQFLNIPTNGQVPYPPDYASTSSVYHLWYSKKSIGKKVEVKETNDDAIGNVLSSQIVQPTKRYPRISYYANYMQFFPLDLGTASFIYFRQPIPPFWDSVNGVFQPNSPLNKDFEFLPQYHNSIIFLMCGYLGISIREADLVQYSQGFEIQNP